jgi:hypothetical protein
MPILKTSVFISSRFEEFKELRIILSSKISNYPSLNLTAIDLNNDRVSSRPPLEESLLNLRRADFMILLVGDTYGETAPGFKKSYTQLEYYEAVKENSNVRIMVFFLGKSYNLENKRALPAENVTFDKWRKQLMDNHIIGFLDYMKTNEELADIIFEKFKDAFFELNFGQLAVETDDDLSFIDGDVNEDILDTEDEADNLSHKNAEKTGKTIKEQNEIISDEFSAIKNPNTVAALENRNEAETAIELKEYSVAIRHLKKALDLKPLDYMSNYLLAKLYIAMGRKDKVTDIIDLSLRSAKIASYFNDDIRASLSYQFTSRGYLLKNEFDEALKYADEAIETAQNYSRAYLEKARVYAAMKNFEGAVESIKRGYDYHPSIVIEAFKDPAFKDIKGDLKKFLKYLIEKSQKDLKEIFKVFKEIEKFVEPDKIIDFTFSNVNQLGNFKQIKETSCKIIEYIIIYIKSLESKAEDFYRQSVVRRQNENNDEPEIDTVDFQFKYSNYYITITEWFFKENDIIKPGDALFTFYFSDNKQAEHQYIFKGDKKTRIYAIRENSVITSQYPELFKCIDPEYEIIEDSPAMILNEEINNLKSQFNSIMYKYNDLKNEINNMSGDYERLNFLSKFLFFNKKLYESKKEEFSELKSKKEIIESELEDKENALNELTQKADEKINQFIDALIKFNDKVMGKSFRMLPFRTFKYGYHYNFKEGSLAKFNNLTVKDTTMQVEDDFPDFLKNHKKMNDFLSLPNKLGYIKENSQSNTLVSFYLPYRELNDEG